MEEGIETAGVADVGEAAATLEGHDLGLGLGLGLVCMGCKSLNVGPLSRRVRLL